MVNVLVDVDKSGVVMINLVNEIMKEFEVEYNKLMKMEFVIVVVKKRKTDIGTDQ
ncbi:hypothetical protein YC2023_076390 [Brassica napus]